MPQAAQQADLLQKAVSLAGRRIFVDRLNSHRYVVALAQQPLQHLLHSNTELACLYAKPYPKP